MEISGVRAGKTGSFVLEVVVAGGKKTKARRMGVGLGTKDRSEAEKTAAVVKRALWRAGLIREGLSLPRGRKANA